MQRGYRNLTSLNGSQIAIVRCHRLVPAKSDPIIGTLSHVLALMDLRRHQIVMALRYDRDTCYLGGSTARKIDVDQRALGPTDLKKMPYDARTVNFPALQSISWRVLRGSWLRAIAAIPKAQPSIAPATVPE